MTVLWTPYMPQSGLTWRQSRIEPSRVAPRRLTGLRNTVARFRFRLPASAADAHCHPGLNPGRRGARPAVGRGSWEAPDADRVPAARCRRAGPRDERGDDPVGVCRAIPIVCRRVPGPAARPVRRPTRARRDSIVKGSVAGGAAFQHCRRGTLTFVVRRTFALTDLRKSEPDIKCKVACGGRRGRAGRFR